MGKKLTHRDRILYSIEHREVDRIPLDYWGTCEATEKIKNYLGVSSDDDFWKILDLDKIINVGPVLKGPRNDTWGIQYKKVPYADGSGFYDEPVKRPLEDFETINQIEQNYTWPTTDMFDYSNIKATCEKYSDYAIEGGYISLLYFYDMLRGTENMLYDLAANDELADYILYKLSEFSFAHVEKIWDAAGGRVDITQVTDDLGSQNDLLMSPEMIKNYMQPYYKKHINAAKNRGIKVFHHDDGAMTRMIPWLVDLGIDVLNPLQWHLPGWDLKKLKSEYKGRLCYHGGIDNQFVLPFGKSNDVRDEVKYCIDNLFVDRTGFILAPCHNVQSITPPENVIEMYKFAKEFS